MGQRRLTFLIGWCVLLSIACSGCLVKTPGPGAARSNLNAETASKIIPEKTTREEVLLILGQPDEVSANGKQFTYRRKYEVALTFPGGPGAGKQSNPATRYLLRLDFDEKGIVSRRYFTAPYEYQDKPVQGYPPYSSSPSEHRQ
ncbi:MAG: hypothetical protein AB9866_24160 [Syntrophobacteraceae bacterium]